MFDKVIISIAENKRKNPLFSLEQRIEFAQSIFENNHQVDVIGFDILLVDFARQQNATVLVRGLRAVADFEFEFQLASMNRHLAPDVESVYLMPAEQYAFISSSLVKEVARLGGDVTKYVHPKVFKALQTPQC
jgi:pantetheine-phosphate adenylyltransferase